MSKIYLLTATPMGLPMQLFEYFIAELENLSLFLRQNIYHLKNLILSEKKK
jgi:hypothetical protein